MAMIDQCQCCCIIAKKLLLRPSFISAGQKIPGVYARPVTRAQKLENLQLCMSFMGNRNVNLQGIYVGGKNYNQNVLYSLFTKTFTGHKTNLAPKYFKVGANYKSSTYSLDL